MSVPKKKTEDEMRMDFEAKVRAVNQREIFVERYPEDDISASHRGKYKHFSIESMWQGYLWGQGDGFDQGEAYQRAFTAA